MHIILVSDRMATAKTLTLTPRHLLFGIFGFVALVLSLSSLFSYVTVRHAAEIRMPFLRDLMRAVNAEESQRSKEVLRENLNAMAIKLGQMQAQVARIDSLGERLAALTGARFNQQQPSDTDKTGGGKTGFKDGRGGPLIQATPLTTTELQNALDALARQVESRGDTLSLIESQLFEERLQRSLLPTTLPLAGLWRPSSGFGWRIDPITGERAMHEGMDFTANVGTPIVAAAGGVVITVESHPQYGLMVDIDHGNDLVTRYAHTSKVFVKPGTLVKRGQKIAAVGNTGRTTGAHLHFEVRLNGSPHNPNRFLQNAQAPSVKQVSMRRR